MVQLLAITHITTSLMLKNMTYDLMLAVPALMLASILGAFTIAHS